MKIIIPKVLFFRNTPQSFIFILKEFPSYDVCYWRTAFIILSWSTVRVSTELQQLLYCFLMRKRHFGVYCTFWRFCYRRLITRNKWLELKLIRSREKNIFNFPQQNYLSLLQSVLKELLCEKLPKLAIHFGEFHKNTKVSLSVLHKHLKKYLHNFTFQNLMEWIQLFFP